MVVLTVVAVPLAASRSQDDPNFDPSGEIYDTLDLVDDQFQSSSPVVNSLFIGAGLAVAAAMAVPRPDAVAEPGGQVATR